MSQQDGGPAFPRNGHPDKNDLPTDGQSLRDYFAGHALAGIAASMTEADFHAIYQKERAAAPESQVAYALADAMLKERDL